MVKFNLTIVELTASKEKVSVLETKVQIQQEEIVGKLTSKFSNEKKNSAGLFVSYLSCGLFTTSRQRTMPAVFAVFFIITLN